jgi:epoxyqueuosine reductase
VGEQVSTRNAIVQDYLAKVDVDLVGVSSLRDVKGTKLEETALRLLSEANSLVVFALEVYPEILNHSRPERATGVASLNDLTDHHLEFLNGRLTKAAYDVAKVSHKNGFKALPLPSVGCPIDGRFLQAVFSYKHAAEAAGLGYIGRSSLLITSDFGPRVRLSCCLTEAILEPKKVTISNSCARCDVCINSCPANALSSPHADEPYAINKFACSSFRNASGGCYECMRLCPAGS